MCIKIIKGNYKIKCAFLKINKSPIKLKDVIFADFVIDIVDNLKIFTANTLYRDVVSYEKRSQKFMKENKIQTNEETNLKKING